MKWVAIAQVFRLSSFSLNLLNIHRLTPLYRVQLTVTMTPTYNYDFPPTGTHSTGECR
jgi:hypothetical protein